MRTLISCVAIAALAATAVTIAQAGPGDVEQSIPPAVSQNPKLPPLHLTDEQRAKIRAAVGPLNTEVTFQLKTTKPAKDFEPKLGAKVPAALKPHALPSAVTQEMPSLGDYAYLKVKLQILIIYAMSGRIVDMFPEGS